MTGHIVVGIDATGSADDALDWATTEAAARGCPLRLVHAFLPPLPADPYGIVPALGGIPQAWADAEHVLAEAEDRARSVARDIRVSTRLVQATAGPALLDEARDACLLVVGSRGLHGPRSWFSRSVSTQVTARASCPVVVIRPRHGMSDPGWSPPRVVVGVDAPGSCTPAVGFAFQAARQRGIPLVAVHAWTPDAPADLEAISAPVGQTEVLARQALQRALDRWQPEFPDVAVHAVLVRGSPARALALHSRGAALLVVGTRGRGHVRDRLLGSAGPTVLRHFHSPLAIVRHDGARTAQSHPVRGRDTSEGHRIVPAIRRWLA
jgi:nucleotide-binding universal stress UspA family protein